MKKSFGKKLVELYRANAKLELLQYAYLILFVAVTVISGLIALIHQAIGVAFLIIPLVCLVAWSMNLVAWSIVKTAIEHFYPEVLKTKTEKSTTKRIVKNSVSTKTPNRNSKKVSKAS
jgi:hypothetical protein